MTNTILHALVIPDDNFRAWLAATDRYRQQFPRVAVLRSPRGNNLNRYRNVTAVQAPNTWFNNDALNHMRRAYPNVVLVDLIEVTSPDQLRVELDRRAEQNDPYGTRGPRPLLFNRFVLDWPVDSDTLRVTRKFDEPVGGGYSHEGIDIAAARGRLVRSSCTGQVIAAIKQPTALGYGRYVQVLAVSDIRQYIITYAFLQNITVGAGDIVQTGQVIGESAGETGMKLVVQEIGRSTGKRYKLPGVLDPIPLIYVEGMTLQTTASSGLNVRNGTGTQFDKVGSLSPLEYATPLEPHGYAILKLETTEAQDQWVQLDTQSGITGFGAGWLLLGRSPRSQPFCSGEIGVNLDVVHPLGAPNPERLGKMGVVRMAYDISQNTGSTDLNAAFNRYNPYLERLARAGKKTILVFDHQTYGEAQGFNWANMSSEEWFTLIERYVSFVKQVVQRFAGRNLIAAYQIWNEQDAEPNAQASVPVPASVYARMLAESIRAIRGIDSTTPIITGGHKSGPANGVAYLQETLRNIPNGTRPDGVAIHPYGRGAEPGLPFAPFGTVEESIGKYGRAVPDLPLWITEFGVLDQNNAPTVAVSQYAMNFINYVRATHPTRIGALVWYAWAEGMHNGYGLVNASDQPREPLYSQYLSLA